MDKKILSTAIAGVLAGSMAFAANADVTLYGQMDLSIDSLDFDTDWVDPGDNSDDINMESNYSALGIKGSEDLGGGLKAIFQAEFQFNPDENSTLTGARDSWIGMDGGFGKLRFGRMSTTYKDSGAMIDPMWRTAFDSRDAFLISGLHSGTGDNGQGRATNAIGYNTPDFNGLSAAATYSLDGDCGIGVPSPCQDDDSYSLGARYNNGPALVFADYITSDVGNNDDGYKVGGKYSFGDLGVFGQYEFDGGMLSAATESSLGLDADLVTPGDQLSGDDGADRWFLGATYDIGNAMLYGAYGQSDSNDTFNLDSDQWALAGAYKFSKRTMAYAGFNQVSSDELGEVDHFALGMRHKF